jgi:hypothetical protein
MLPARAYIDAYWFGPDDIGCKLLPRTLFIGQLLLYFYGAFCGAILLNFPFYVLIAGAKNNIGTISHP